MSATQLRADVAIVGGGIVGGAAALFLRRYGRSVVLLERDRVGQRASGVNFGGVRQQGRDLRELPLSFRAREIWAALPSYVGIDGERQFTGHLRLARNAADMATLESYREGAGALGLKLELLGRNALIARFPWIGPSIAGGSFCPSDGQANPRLVGPAFAQAAARAGARIEEGAEVIATEIGSSGFRLTTAHGLEVEATVLVNAAGAWAGHYAESLGEPIGLKPMIPQILVTEPIAHRFAPVLGIIGGELYLRQIPRGNVIFGTVERPAGEDFRRTPPTAETAFASNRAALKIVPELAQAQIIRNWAGVDGYSADGVPVIGPSRRHAGLFHAFGFCGHGFQLGPAAGEAIAQMIAQGRTDLPVAALSLARFAAA